PEKVEVVRVAPVVVQTEHVHVRVAGQSIWNGLGKRVIVGGLVACRRRELADICCGNGADASLRNSISGKLLSGCHASSSAGGRARRWHINFVTWSCCPVHKVPATLGNRWY